MRCFLPTLRTKHSADVPCPRMIYAEFLLPQRGRSRPMQCEMNRTALRNFERGFCVLVTAMEAAKAEVTLAFR